MSWWYAKTQARYEHCGSTHESMLALWKQANPLADEAQAVRVCRVCVGVRSALTPTHSDPHRPVVAVGAVGGGWCRVVCASVLCSTSPPGSSPTPLSSAGGAWWVLCVRVRVSEVCDADNSTHMHALAQLDPYPAAMGVILLLLLGVIAAVFVQTAVAQQPVCVLYARERESRGRCTHSTPPTHTTHAQAGSVVRWVHWSAITALLLLAVGLFGYQSEYVRCVRVSVSCA